MVAMALRIVDEDGAAELSMRTLAQRLDSGTATLYRHFGNRAGLVAHVVDHVFGEVEFEVDELAAMGWRQACRTAAQGMFDALSRHPNVAPLLVERVPVGPNAMALRERCLAVLLGDGFPAPLAAQSYATVARYVLGFAIQLNGAGDDPDFQDVDPATHSATAAVAEWLPVSLQDEFAFGLGLLVSGLDELRANLSS
jgi:TetR/AcrR family transcriptional regulator, tetracycline repressor protein